MVNKYTIEIVKALFNDEGYTVLNNEYENSKAKLNFICPNKHKHSISLGKWLAGQRCKYCSGLVSKTIDQVNRIFEKENYELLSKSYLNTNSKLKFKCPNGHIHKTTLRNWNKGNRCPYCSGKAKKTLKGIEAEFSKEGYKLHSTKYINCEGKLKYECPNGHIMLTSWSVWKRGFRCPKCSGLAKLDFSTVKNDVENKGYKLVTRTYINNHKKLTLICPNDHEYKVSYANWKSKGYRCPKCSAWGTSKAESEILEFIKTVYKGEIITNDRTIIAPKELDIVITDKKIAIEYCGLYWHSELMGKDRNYHLNKLKECEKLGYALITIFEDEWLLKNNITKSRLSSYINSKHMKNIYARNCTIKEISAEQARLFCNSNHLQGYGAGASIKLGAFYGDDLVALMTFSKPSLAKGVKENKRVVFELHRFCSKINTTVVGIASKLLNHFEKSFYWEYIYTFADMRWSLGNLYEKLDFEFLYNASPNYWYFKGSNIKRLHRFGLRKNKNDIQELTEVQNRTLQGYNRIWDCGNIKYIKENKGLF